MIRLILDGHCRSHNSNNTLVIVCDVMRRKKLKFDEMREFDIFVISISERALLVIVWRAQIASSVEH